MRYRRRYPEIEAEQFHVGRQLPRGVALCAGGDYAIRVSDCSHDNPRDGDYVVYHLGEYPTVWRREEFEREFELVED
jgi:hypothetical protein